jgi:ATP/ADP translocase
VAARPSYEAESVDAASRSIGLVVVAVLTVLIVFVTILMAFSTVNTPMSNDGDGATRSQWISPDADD